jgi:hypothetical protein
LDREFLIAGKGAMADPSVGFRRRRSVENKKAGIPSREPRPSNYGHPPDVHTKRLMGDGSRIEHGARTLEVRGTVQVLE